MVADGGEDMRERYVLFCALESSAAAIDPYDLTADELVAIVDAIAAAGGRREPDRTNVVRLSAHRNSPSWEQVWSVFVDGIRRERLRVGQLLGIEPPSPPPSDIPCIGRTTDSE
jgi:hypothetical protein